MPVRFQCPHCLSHLTVSRKFAGKRGLCPNCKSKIQVPEISIDDPFDDTQDVTLTDGEPVIGQVATQTATAERAGQTTTRTKRRSGRTAVSPLATKDRVSVARWIIYMQGALLGLTATTFFVFGMAVGNTTGGSNPTGQDGNCVISGSVYFDRGSERIADDGAVVILLPIDTTPRNRPDATGLRPDQFQPVRNKAIDEIRAMGGCIVRVDHDGNYQAELDNNKSYWWLVISRNQRANNDTIGKQTRAELGSYFLPIEDLLGDRDFMWHKVRVSGSKQQMQVVTF